MTGPSAMPQRAILSAAPAICACPPSCSAMPRRPAAIAPIWPHDSSSIRRSVRAARRQSRAPRPFRRAFRPVRAWKNAQYPSSRPCRRPGQRMRRSLARARGRACDPGRPRAGASPRPGARRLRARILRACGAAARVPRPAAAAQRAVSAATRALRPSVPKAFGAPAVLHKAVLTPACNCDLGANSAAIEHGGRARSPRRARRMSPLVAAARDLDPRHGAGGRRRPPRLPSPARCLNVRRPPSCRPGDQGIYRPAPPPAP